MFTLSTVLLDKATTVLLEECPLLPADSNTVLPRRMAVRDEEVPEPITIVKVSPGVTGIEIAYRKSPP
jgi:hypothetical protein